jgi:hypothetical protein
VDPQLLHARHTDSYTCNNASACTSSNASTCGN